MELPIAQLQLLQRAHASNGVCFVTEPEEADALALDEAGLGVFFAQDNLLYVTARGVSTAIASPKLSEPGELAA